MDYQADLYDPIYDEIGVEATIDLGTAGTVDVTVIDKTSGVAVADRNLIETIKPVAYIRAAELESLSIDKAMLRNLDITFNGTTWRILAIGPKPSPKGESDGEYMLTLTDEIAS